MSLRSKFARLSPRHKHHILISAVVGLATAAHYALALLAPTFQDLSPLAGFLASLVWLWAD